MEINLIKHSDQRYNTVGDWYTTETDEIVINVSDSGNNDTNFLVTVHELIEQYLCERHNISATTVDNWDTSHPDAKDPGSLPGCPYGLAHGIALSIEKYLSSILGMDWKAHEELLDSL